MQTLRGAGARAAAERRDPWPEAVAEAAIVLLALGLAVVAGIVGFVVGRESVPEPARVTTPAAMEESSAGRSAYEQAGCGSCHAFEAAGSTGAVGPSLDESTLRRARIVEIVTNGRGGMPSFAGRLSGEEIERIAAFVAEQRRGG